MLMHLRVVAPPDLSDQVSTYLLEQSCTTAVVCHDDVSGDPEGQLIACDIAREGINAVLDHLTNLGVAEHGAITVLQPTGTPYAAADAIEASEPGAPADAVVWDSVLEQAETGSMATLSFMMFLILAVTLASIAVITDSAVLVVGAMVVGPEFAAVASICLGLVFRRWVIAGKATALLVASFASAIVIVTLMALLARAGGLITVEMLSRPRPQTGFIWNPDVWSFVVALVAGTIGVLALSLNQSNAMVGVFISVTTVPAAGNLALGLALWDVREITGSLTQLGINIGGMLLAGTVFLIFQRLFWVRLSDLVERTFNRG